MLEKITNRQIGHLHGSFSKIKKRVFAQSLGVFYDFTRYDLTTLIFGDYFLSKSFYQTTAKIAMENPQNSKVEFYADLLNRVIKQKNSQTIVIFGLNIENDYHIIRDIQYNLALNKCTSNTLIYCYYNDKEKDSFLKIYNECITFSNELNELIRNKIQLKLIHSHNILDEFFNSK